MHLVAPRPRSEKGRDVNVFKREGQRRRTQMIIFRSMPPEIKPEPSGSHSSAVTVSECVLRTCMLTPDLQRDVLAQEYERYKGRE